MCGSIGGRKFQASLHIVHTPSKILYLLEHEHTAIQHAVQFKPTLIAVDCLNIDIMAYQAIEMTDQGNLFAVSRVA